MTLSLCLHGMVWYGWSARTMETQAPPDPSVSISYLRYEPRPAEAPKAAPAEPLPAAAPALTRRTSTAAAAAAPPKRRREPARQFATEPLPLPAAPVSQSSDVIKDPKRGRVFTNYFGTVKDRINRTIRRKYVQNSLGSGSVTLMFILDRRGAIDNAWVASSQSTAGPYAQEFALASLRAAGPFGPFPPELDLPRIAFTVTVLFEDAIA